MARVEEEEEEEEEETEEEEEDEAGGNKNPICRSDFHSVHSFIHSENGPGAPRSLTLVVLLWCFFFRALFETRGR